MLSHSAFIEAPDDKQKPRKRELPGLQIMYVGATDGAASAAR